MTVFHTDKETAIIFDIMRFSLNDGPGIRTSIFFKGCPLRCLWCHNPESYIAKRQLIYHSHLCTGCMKCVDVCEYGVHKSEQVNNQLIHTVDHKKCVACGKCMKVCCYDALSLAGEIYTAEELLEKIKVDLQYFNIGKNLREQGGITLTGGEPMQQYKFIDEFLNLTGSIHICMETSGYAKTEQYAKIRERVNLFLFDYKATNREKHKALCGMDNELILKNLDYLYNMGSDIVLRLPLIPGINDDDEHMHGIAKLLKKYPNISHGEIMSYNNFGVSKSESIGDKAYISDLSNTTSEQKKIWLEKLHQQGVENIIFG